MQFSTRVVFFFKKYPAFLFAFLATHFCNRRRNLFQEKDDVMVLSTWQTNCLWEEEAKEGDLYRCLLQKSASQQPPFSRNWQGKKRRNNSNMMGEREREGESDGECSSCDKEERKQKKKWWWWSNQIPKQFESFFPVYVAKWNVCAVRTKNRNPLLKCSEWELGCCEEGISQTSPQLPRERRRWVDDRFQKRKKSLFSHVCEGKEGEATTSLWISSFCLQCKKVSSQKRLFQSRK